MGGNWPGAEETLTGQREDESQGRAGKGRGSAHAHVHSVQATEPKRQHWLWCPLRPRQDARRKPMLPPPELTWNMHTTRLHCMGRPQLTEDHLDCFKILAAHLWVVFGF